MITELVSRWERADVAVLDECGGQQALADMARVANWVVAVRAAVVRRLDELGDEQRWQTEGVGPPSAPPGDPVDGGVPKVPRMAAETLADLVVCGRITDHEARRQADVARMLGRFPRLAAALAASTAAESHVDVVHRCWRRLHDEDRGRLAALDGELVELAANHDPERFHRLLTARLNALRRGDGLDRLVKQRRATRLTSRRDGDGMVHVHAAFDPERGERLLGRIRRRRAALFPEGGELPTDCPADERYPHLDALALLDLTASGGETSVPTMFAAPAVELAVVVDVGTLRSGIHADTVLDADLPVPTLRRLACEAGIVPVVLGGGGEVLDVGRVRRVATHAQRVALRVLYPTCAVPGCEVRFDHCQPHHLQPWELGGPTDLANLLPLCGRHHHDAHEGGWKLHLADDRTLTIVRPGGHVMVGYPVTRRLSNAFDGSPDLAATG